MKAIRLLEADESNVVKSRNIVLKLNAPGFPGVYVGAWCNGSTADFGSVYPGSNPGAPVESG
jgi:hypothetical protein